MDLDRFDPLASPSNALDYSSLSPEELDKLIDHVYSAQLSPQCEAAIIGKVFLLFLPCFAHFFASFGDLNVSDVIKTLLLFCFFFLTN